MILAYGVANLLQSMAAARTSVHHTFDPGLLVRLAGQRTYLLGIACQTLGFVLAFLARRDLPLFLVQASVAAGLGVTAVLGVVLLKWSLPTAEVLLLGLLLAGITALVLAAQPAHSRQIGPIRREWAGWAASTSAVIPASSSPSSSTSAVGRLHLRISTPSTAVTPSPAATLACTRNSGRSRRARKARTNPSV